jgi:hypothetical protein
VPAASPPRPDHARAAGDEPGPTQNRPHRDRSVRIAAVVIGALVLGAIALITFALTRPEPPSFVPTPIAQLPPPDASGAHTITIDASSSDQWRFLSFQHGVLPGRAAGAEWDLAFRRFHIIANGGPGFAGSGGIIDLGPVSFDSVRTLPATGYAQTTLARRDSVNPAIDRWYRYGFTSHLLTPLQHTYAVRAADGNRIVKLEVLGYYCPGATPGCVTIRWSDLHQ